MLTSWLSKVHLGINYSRKNVQALRVKYLSSLQCVRCSKSNNTAIVNTNIGDSEPTRGYYSSTTYY